MKQRENHVVSLQLKSKFWNFLDTLDPVADFEEILLINYVNKLFYVETKKSIFWNSRLYNLPFIQIYMFTKFIIYRCKWF